MGNYRTSWLRIRLARTDANSGRAKRLLNEEPFREFPPSAFFRARSSKRLICLGNTWLKLKKRVPAGVQKLLLFRKGMDYYLSVMRYRSVNPAEHKGAVKRGVDKPLLPSTLLGTLNGQIPFTDAPCAGYSG